MKHLCLFRRSTKSHQLNPNEKKNLPWKDVQQHIEIIGQKIVKIPSQWTLLTFGKIQREEKDIAQKIWQEIKDQLTSIMTSLHSQLKN